MTTNLQTRLWMAALAAAVLMVPAEAGTVTSTLDPLGLDTIVVDAGVLVPVVSVDDITAAARAASPSGIDGIVDDGARLLVPVGYVLRVDGPLVRDQVTLGGLVESTGDLVIEAREITVLSGSVLRAADGAPADLEVGRVAAGADGADGRSVYLLATQAVTVDAGAYVLAGSGGAGGSVLGTTDALAGDGGRGGDVVLDAPVLHIAGTVLPGAGGDGGHATAIGAAAPTASAGSGGDAGQVLVSGTPVQLPVPEVLAPVSVTAALVDLSAVCTAIQQLINKDVETPEVPELAELVSPAAQSSRAAAVEVQCPDLSAADEALATVNDLVDECAGTGIQLSAAQSSRFDAVELADAAAALDCQAVIAELLQLPAAALATVDDVIMGCGLALTSVAASSPSTRQASLVDADLSVCRETIATASALVASAGATATEAVGTELEGCGLSAVAVAASTERSSSRVQYGGHDCNDVKNGVVGDVVGLSLVPGAPGLSGTPGVGCTVSHGSDGASNMMGDGGDGGDGCTEGYGNDGSNGANGNSGFVGCSDGGWGGQGANGVAGPASGGTGGQGLYDGGDGGSATSYGKGGNGGNGGKGGKATLGRDCAGGNGGNGGSGKGGDVAPGPGGNGLCGRGGSGGLASSNADGGSGGSGGSGNPSGLPGLAGTGVSGSGNGATGVGGTGPGVCPGPIDTSTLPDVAGLTA